MDLVVGFDLDLTLVDSRPSVVAVAAQLAAEEGVRIDGELWASRLGPPLEQELVHWVPAHDVDRVADRYRALMHDHLDKGTLLPGAREAVQAVRALGGRAVVVTAKQQVLAEKTLALLGVEVDEVVGWAWREAKGAALRERGAQVYVGDHPHDVDAARVAGCVAYGVLTGGSPPLGADVVADDLTGFPVWLGEHVLDRRLADLDAHLRSLGEVVVAFSGGADSAFLLTAAVRALGPERVTAATAVSPSLAQAELPAARAFAEGLGVRHVTPGTDEGSNPDYVRNGTDRCFHCKATLLDTLAPLGTVLTGTNADDLVAGFRPGIAAAAQRGAITPLQHLTKAQVRAASARWGLATADKPALACLASRIAYGVEVTPQRLSRVDRAETALRAHLAPRDVRVRDLGDGSARVELDPGALGRYDADAHALVLQEFDRATAVAFVSGSMNLVAPAVGTAQQAQQGEAEADREQQGEQVEGRGR